MNHATRRLIRLCALPAVTLFACGNSSGGGSGTARVQLKNDFKNPHVTGFQPPWTICESSYQGIQFGKLEIGQSSATQEVLAGLDYVLMVAAWNDPGCDPSHSLPIASSTEEEVVSGQARTIAVGMTNHQGPCPPEGIPPIPQEQYDRILQLWPSYGFTPYANRANNTQCAGSGATDHDGGTDSGPDGNHP